MMLMQLVRTDNGQYLIQCRNAQSTKFELYYIDGSGSGKPTDFGNIKWTVVPFTGTHYDESDIDNFNDALQTVLSRAAIRHGLDLINL